MIRNIHNVDYTLKYNKSTMFVKMEFQGCNQYNRDMDYNCIDEFFIHCQLNMNNLKNKHINDHAYMLVELVLLCMPHEMMNKCVPSI